MEPPKGIASIIHTFGDPMKYVNAKRDWETVILNERPLPEELPYAYGPVKIYRIRAHRLVVNTMVTCITQCLRAGVEPEKLSYGGCYSWRPMRGGLKLSTHTWGIAIDLDPANNARGLQWDGGKKMIPKTVVDIFKSSGFTWGGDFKIPDCMHFQFARGY